MARHILSTRPRSSASSPTSTELHMQEASTEVAGNDNSARAGADPEC
jgi:hypothetical protein